MNTQRLAIAAAVLALASAAQAQNATINQSGNLDQATIEQTNPPGTYSSATINQSGGGGNQATVQQAANGSAAYTATAIVTQQNTTTYVANVSQFGGVNANIQLTQGPGMNSTAELLQFHAIDSQILAAQSGVNQTTRIQQVEFSNNAYVRTNQTGTDSTLIIIQGQPAGGVTNSQARTFQGGTLNDSLTVQTGSNLNAYTSQGGAPSSAGSYYSNAAGGFVVVDATVVPTISDTSRATILQLEGSGHTAYILQYGSGLHASVNQTGNGHTGGFLQTGFNNVGSINQSGTSHNAAISQRGSMSAAAINQSGFGNRASVRQN